MQPTGIEPALKASEAFVLSVRLRLQILQNCYTTLIIIPQKNAPVYNELEIIAILLQSQNLFNPFLPTVVSIKTIR